MHQLQEQLQINLLQQTHMMQVKQDQQQISERYLVPLQILNFQEGNECICTCKILSIKSDVAKTKLSKKEGTFSGHYVLLLVKKERLDNLVNEKQFDSGIL